MLINYVLDVGITIENFIDMETLAMNHANLVENMAKPGGEILAEMTADQMHLLHMAVGVSGEAGELIDAIKKYAVYQKPLDKENVIEELGDLEFYMQGIRAQLDITRDQTLRHNIDKLNKRYAGKYSNKQAQERADKPTQNTEGSTSTVIHSILDDKDE